jgi:hypothetical protein
MFICPRLPPFLGFCLGGCRNFEGFEIGQIVVRQKTAFLNARICMAVSHTNERYQFLIRKIVIFLPFFYSLIPLLFFILFTCQSSILRRIFVLSFIHEVRYWFRTLFAMFTYLPLGVVSQADLFFATQRCSVNIDMCKHITGVYSCINTVFTPLRLSACLPVFLPPIHSVLSWLIPKHSVPYLLQTQYLSLNVPV